MSTPTRIVPVPPAAEGATEAAEAAAEAPWEAAAPDGLAFEAPQAARKAAAAPNAPACINWRRLSIGPVLPDRAARTASSLADDTPPAAIPPAATPPTATSPISPSRPDWPALDIDALLTGRVPRRTRAHCCRQLRIVKLHSLMQHHRSA